MQPVPLGLDPDLATFLADLRETVAQMQNPGQPAQEFAVTQAKLPPADKYKNCRCLVTDKNTMAVSTSVAGTWTWLRANGSAL